MVIVPRILCITVLRNYCCYVMQMCFSLLILCGASSVESSPQQTAESHARSHGLTAAAGAVP